MADTKISRQLAMFDKGKKCQSSVTLVGRVHCFRIETCGL